MPEWSSFYLTPIKIMVIATCFHAVAFLRKSDRRNSLLLLILLLGAINELQMSTLNLLGFCKHPALDLNFIAYNLFWLGLLMQMCRLKGAIKAALIVFGLIAVANLLFFEGMAAFNFITVMIGGLLYLLFFTLENYRRLREEDYSFFISNHYLLLFAPVTFFFSYGLLFSFRSHFVNGTLLFHNIELWDFVTYYANSTYYVLINIFIYRESRRVARTAY